MKNKNDIDLDGRIEKLEHENKALKNRCHVLSMGTICFYCPLECEHRSCDFRNNESEA